MIRKSFLFCLLVVSAMCLKAQDQTSDVAKVGQAMPAFSIVSDDGKILKSSDFKGKVLLITFFATWCPPCQEELAEINKCIWSKYKDNKNFKLLVIGREHTDADLQKYNQQKGFSFPLYPDKNRAIFAAFAKNMVPRSYLVGKDGKIIFMLKGYSKEKFPRLLTEIEKVL